MTCDVFREGPLSSFGRPRRCCRPSLPLRRAHAAHGRQGPVEKVEPCRIQQRLDGSDGRTDWPVRRAALHGLAVDWHGYDDVQGGPVRKSGLHYRCRHRGNPSRERQIPPRPHLSRRDHLHCARDSMPMRRCHVLCLHGSSCSKWWLTLHEEDLLCIRCHAHVPVCTQKQPFKRERCSLMDGHGWPCERPQ